MANGIQRTPLDTGQLGSQLLEAFVAAEQNKRQKEQLKLEEQRLVIQDEQNKRLARLQAAPYIAPEGRSTFLQDLFGAQATPQPTVEDIAAKKQADLQNYLLANPRVAEMHQRLQLIDTTLPEDEALDEARIAAGLRANIDQRIEVGRDFFAQFGSHGINAWNEYVGTQLGVTAPSGVPTMPERQTGAVETSYGASAAEAKARAALARAQLAEMSAQGWEKVDPNLPDDEFFAHIAEYNDVIAGKRLFVSPKAAAAIIPRSKAAEIAKLVGEPSERVKLRIQLLGQAIDYLNGKNVRPSPADLEYVSGLMREIHAELQPPGQRQTRGGAPEGGSFDLSGAVLSLVTGTDIPPFEIGGRPIKPEVLDMINDIGRQLQVGATGATAGFFIGGPKGAAIGAAGGMALGLASPALKRALGGLETVFADTIVPLITDEPTPKPRVGALSSPAAKQVIPAEALDQYKKLMQVYFDAGASPQEVADEEMGLLYAHQQIAAGKFTLNDLKEALAALANVVKEKRVAAKTRTF